LVIKTFWAGSIYRIEGKQNRLSFGAYPDTTLENARRKTEEARAQIANVIDPSETKKQAGQVDAENAKRKAAGLPILNSFEYVVRVWLNSIEYLTGATIHINKTSRPWTAGVSSSWWYGDYRD